MRWILVFLLALPAACEDGARCGAVSGHEASELRCLLGDDVALEAPVGHGESGVVWRGRRKPNLEESVVVKFRCCREECRDGTVCGGASAVSELGYECEAGYDAHERAPELVAACLDPTSRKSFIVLKDVGGYLSAQDHLEDFMKLDKSSNRSLLRQVLRAVQSFLEPKNGRSLVHMDLTSANIMYHPKTGKVQLIDFSQVEYCETLARSRSSPAPGRCVPKQFLKDLKKEVLHLALASDLLDTPDAARCVRRVRRLNFEKSRAQRMATDDFVADALGEGCRSEISAWSWSLLRWLGHLDRHLVKVLPTVPAGHLRVQDVFQDGEPWSLREFSKIYD